MTINRHEYSNDDGVKVILVYNEKKMEWHFEVVSCGSLVRQECFSDYSEALIRWRKTIDLVVSGFEFNDGDETKETEFEIAIDEIADKDEK